MKIRASTQNCRVKSARHNDRKFEVDKAYHIDAARSELNVNQTWRGKSSVDFATDERLYYEQTFTDALNRTNEKYIQNGHQERVRTIDDWLNGSRTCPEESIYQLGNKDISADADLLFNCYSDLFEFLEEWSKEHNNAFKILDFSLHLDEATPHIHQRRVWQYRDEEGLMRIGQDKALELAGVELPHPNEPPSRYNNRKMTFDNMVRDKWLDIAEEHGISVEREPLADGRHHQDKEDFIRSKNEELLNETMQLAQKHNELVDTIEQLENRSVSLAYSIVKEHELNQREEKIR